MTSPSTLARRARKAKTPAAAKRLRALAAKKRREIRAERKKPVVKRTVHRRKRPAFDRLDPKTRTEVNRQAEVGQSIVEGALQQPFISEFELATLRKLAHNRKHPMTFDIAVRSKIADARHRGGKQSDETNTTRLRTVYEANRIAVVSGFIAEMNAVAKWHGGPMPAACVLSGYTVARILEALRDAGFTESGKDSGARPRG